MRRIITIGRAALAALARTMLVAACGDDRSPTQLAERTSETPEPVTDNPWTSIFAAAKVLGGPIKATFAGATDRSFQVGLATVLPGRRIGPRPSGSQGLARRRRTRGRSGARTPVRSLPSKRPADGSVRWMGWLAPSIAVLGVLAVLVLASAPAPVAAQCHVCDRDDCEDGGGGSSCTEVHSGESQTCQTTGGCTCVKVRKRFWPDGQICTPDEEPMTALSDTRHVDHAGSLIAVRRVSASYYAASACGSDRWVVLAREFPDGRWEVTTNSLAIRLQRWAFGLGDEDRSAEDR